MAFMKEKRQENHHEKGRQREETMVCEPIKEKNRFHIILKVILLDRERNQVGRNLTQEI